MASIPLKPIMHIENSPHFHKIYKFSSDFLKIYKFPPYFLSIDVLLPNLLFFDPPILTMRHLCIMLYTNWTPMFVIIVIRYCYRAYVILLEHVIAICYHYSLFFSCDMNSSFAIVIYLMACITYFLQFLIFTF